MTHSISIVRGDTTPSAKPLDQQANQVDYFDPRFFEWERLYQISLRSAASRKQTRSKLTVLRRMFQVPTGGTVPWSRLTINTVNEFKAMLASEQNGYLDKAYSNSSINSFVAVIKGIIRAGINEGHIPSDSTAYRILTGVRAEHTNDIDPSLRPAIADRKLLSFLREAGEAPGPIGKRDKAICYILAHAGLRRSEVCWLTTANYNSDEALLHFRGKGNKIRRLKLPESAGNAIDQWIEEYRGDYDGVLFPAIRSDETIDYHRALQPESINYILLRIQKRLYGDSKEEKKDYFSPHQLRYSFASRKLSAGVDLSLLQQLLGHSSMSTTAIYDKRSTEVLDEAMTQKGQLG